MARQKSRVFKTLITVFILLLILLSASAIGLLVMANILDDVPADTPSSRFFTVNNGDNVSNIAERLEDSGFIKSALYFRLLARVGKHEASIKAGHYEFKENFKTSDILSILVEGRQLLVKIRIPEGSTSSYIARVLEENGITKGDEFLELVGNTGFAESIGLSPGTGLEGYLFPDTYFFNLETGAKKALETMVDNFFKRLYSEIPEAKSIELGDLHKRVIMASIIEREYYKPSEAALMSSVFWNRLRIGMALQSCASVVYIISERQGKPHPTRIFDRDLEIDDPFNTYKYPGLPPAPISNPGLIALRAAFRPETSSYLYFRLVDEETGSHYFSQTFDEHIKAASLIVKP